MDKYENIEVVGEGSYGIVMKCRHRETGQIVAIKKFLETEEDIHVRKMAFREIRMLKKLRHDNLVNMIEVFRKKRRFYLVFEYLDHTVLDEVEATPGGLGANISRRHIFQVLRGLNFCHCNHIMHRDIKPENVLVSPNGVIKLCDFGFARFVSGRNDTCTDYVATRWYRAPELLIGDSKYGKPVDVWALGCLYAEMVTGDPLFPGESDVDQLFEITKVLGGLCGKHQTIIGRTNIYSTRHSRKMNINTELNVSSSHSIRPLRILFPTWSASATDFLSQCLRMDPDTRPTCTNLLQHPLFMQDGFAEKFRIELQTNISKENAQNPLIQKRIIENRRHHTVNSEETPRTYESAGKWRLHLMKEMGNFNVKQDQDECIMDIHHAINEKADVSSGPRRQKMTIQQPLCISSVPIISPSTTTYMKRLDYKGMSLNNSKGFSLPALPLRGNKTKRDNKTFKNVATTILRS